MALGMTSYEARAYVALLAAGKQLNGYEVAKRSGLPRTAIYETLSKLTARGAAFEVRNDDDAVAYLPLPGESYLARLQSQFGDTMAALRESVPRVSRPAPKVVHRLEDSQGVLARARDLIRGASKEVYLMLFAEELTLIADDLQAAEQRGIEVTTVLIGESDTEIGTMYRHRFRDAEHVAARLGCRLFLVVVDIDDLLISAAVDDHIAGMYTNEPAMVLVALELIRHDAAIQALADRHGWTPLRELLDSDPEIHRLATGRLPSLGA
jgi:sugar-specific transcriptional regulator TrmB